MRSQIFSHAGWHTAAPGEHSLPAKGHGQPFSHLPSAVLHLHGRAGHSSVSADSCISHAPDTSIITAWSGPDASELLPKPEQSLPCLRQSWSAGGQGRMAFATAPADPSLFFFLPTLFVNLSLGTFSAAQPYSPLGHR